GSSDVLATINADRARADEQGVTGTPTFFVNEERIDNPQDPSEFFRIIDEYIERETGEPSQNSPLNQEGELDGFPGEGNQQNELPEGFDPEDLDLSDVEPTEE
ncbi:MAG: DsbA family protein, partial [Actinobacteria bacterium]|nr:DsbA family protein [Actinomycetota bacterium]